MFVLLDLRSDFSNKLLSLSFKENPDSLIFCVRDLISVFEANLNLVRTRVSPHLFV